MKTLFRLFTFCVLVALVIAGYLGWQAHKLLIPAAPAGAKLVAFEVVTGTSGSEIAHQLKMAGVIDDELCPGLVYTAFPLVLVVVLPVVTFVPPPPVSTLTPPAPPVFTFTPPAPPTETET